MKHFDDSSPYIEHLSPEAAYDRGFIAGEEIGNEGMKMAAQKISLIADELLAEAAVSPGERVREFYREQGRKQEQERIIKLLETLKGTCDNDCDECRPHAERNAHFLTALQDLIKGEN